MQSVFGPSLRETKNDVEAKQETWIGAGPGPARETCEVNGNGGEEGNVQVGAESEAASAVREGVVCQTADSVREETWTDQKMANGDVEEENENASQNVPAACLCHVRKGAAADCGFYGLDLHGSLACPSTEEAEGEACPFVAYLDPRPPFVAGLPHAA